MHEREWDIEADIVVLGFGAAGSAAAITAARKGASVVLVEKQESDRHTPNFRMSGGLCMTFTDAEAAEVYLSKCAGPAVGRPEIRVLAERGTGLLNWLREQCGTPFTLVNKSEHPEFEGAEAIEVYQQGRPRFKQDPSAGNGASLYASLRKVVEALGVPILWGTAAHRLVREDGRITGVIARGDRELRIGARRGVVLCTGGFEFDDAAKWAFLRASPMYFYGNPGNTGDGLRMAQEVGADLWNMTQMVGRAVGRFRKANGEDENFFISVNPSRLEVAPFGYVILDGEGRRFANEHDQAMNKHAFYYHLIQFDTDRGNYPRIPCYWLFDERRRVQGPATLLNAGAASIGTYVWSQDNSREIAQGWIVQGGTPEEAAEAAGHENPSAVASAIREYNAHCAAGSDAHGRPPHTMVPIDEAPFYCMKLWPGGPNTTGGPRRDARGRILDVRGEPIGGLYGAGELGQVSGQLYPADGGNLCEAFCFGQIAVEAALDVIASA